MTDVIVNNNDNSNNQKMELLFGGMQCFNQYLVLSSATRLDVGAHDEDGILLLGGKGWPP